MKRLEMLVVLLGSINRGFFAEGVHDKAPYILAV